MKLYTKKTSRRLKRLANKVIKWIKSFFYNKEKITKKNKPLVSLLKDPKPSRKKTTGIRNNNFLNVKGSRWRGQVSVDDRGHAVFNHPREGLRAAIITLRTYWTKHKLKTIGQILSRWAPTYDTIGSLPGSPPNSPYKYSIFVQSRTGFHPNENLKLFTPGGDVNDAEQIYKVLSAMAEYENYAGFAFSKTHFDEAINIV